MAGKFVLKKGTTGKFRFNLLASNGQVIATSEAYESRAAALKGIESVRKHAADARLADGTETPGRAKAARGPSKSGSAAGRALKRDWEQTKSDLPGLKGKDINQDVGDTLEQAAGKKKAPATSNPNPAS
jgi:uncharacterized protein YegP (UPF0339 family)